jgi:hypothetical protein
VSGSFRFLRLYAFAGGEIPLDRTFATSLHKRCDSFDIFCRDYLLFSYAKWIQTASIGEQYTVVSTYSTKKFGFAYVMTSCT